MTAAGKFLRKIETGYEHWCPACQEMHTLPDGWDFDGNMDAPTFTSSPSSSFLHRFKKRKYTNGRWDGWELDAAGNMIDVVCHYNITSGMIVFHGDCSHGWHHTVPMVEITTGLCSGI